MQTEQLSRLQLSPVWGKTMNVEFTFQSSPSLFWVLAKCPGGESSARENSHPIVQLSICWLSPGPGTSTSWASQTSDLTRSSVPPRETPKATWGPGFLCCCQKGPPKTWGGGAVPGDPGLLQVTSCSCGTSSKGTSIVSKYPHVVYWTKSSGFQAPWSSMGRLSWVPM